MVNHDIFLKAAFDTVDHGILMNVLRERFGIEHHEIEWFESYHTDRTQIFKTPTSTSSPVKLTCSVPHGSRIGPQEFSIYTENIVGVINNFIINHHLYADDLQLLAHMSLEAVSNYWLQLEICVGRLRDWCSSRRLQLNPEKNRSDMVRFEVQPCETRAFGHEFEPWCGHCQPSRICARPRSHSGQRTVHAATHQ